MLVLTQAGDVVEIEISKSFNNKIKAKRINAINKINGTMKALAVLN